MLMSNKASLGGAVYIAAVDDKQTVYLGSVFSKATRLQTVARFTCTQAPVLTSSTRLSSATILQVSCPDILAYVRSSYRNASLHICKTLVTGLDKILCYGGFNMPTFQLR